MLNFLSNTTCMNTTHSGFPSLRPLDFCPQGSSVNGDKWLWSFITLRLWRKSFRTETRVYFCCSDTLPDCFIYPHTVEYGPWKMYVADGAPRRCEGRRWRGKPAQPLFPLFPVFAPFAFLVLLCSAYDSLNNDASNEVNNLIWSELI